MAQTKLPPSRSRTRSTARTASSTAKGAAQAAQKTVRGKGVREAAAQATKDSILRAATKVFARHGFDGGSIEKISSSAETHDRMIYYYFGSKEGLFIAVLEGIYHRMDIAEARIAPDTSDPVAALNTIIRFKLDFYRRNPDFVALLNTENLHKGRHVSKSEKAVEYSSHAVRLIEQILASGAAQGLFRPELQARDVLLLIIAAAYFYTSNRFTLSAFLGEKLDSADAEAHWDAFVLDSVHRVVRA